MSPSPGAKANLAEDVLAGDRWALARLLSQIEDGDTEGQEGLIALFPHGGRAHRIGITGPPGTGKSTLVGRLAQAFRSITPNGRATPLTVGIVAVDPSSPFTGGAILGDRIRMGELAGDPGVFIRSMASRGALGGLSRTTGDVVEALDGAGFDVLLIETVGAGQAEVDIARAAQSTIVVEAPGLGDDVQAIKAGILEAADILVVNKADLPGADSTLRALRMSVELGYPRMARAEAEGGVWVPPVLMTQALKGEGVSEVVDAIRGHREYLERSGEGTRRERRRLQAEVEACLREQLAARLSSQLPDGRLEAAVADVVTRRQTPRQAADRLLVGMPR
jgi:LAO/AO transport system kinase